MGPTSSWRTRSWHYHYLLVLNSNWFLRKWMKTVKNLGRSICRGPYYYGVWILFSVLCPILFLFLNPHFYLQDKMQWRKVIPSMNSQVILNLRLNNPIGHHHRLSTPVFQDVKVLRCYHRRIFSRHRHQDQQGRQRQRRQVRQHPRPRRHHGRLRAGHVFRPKQGAYSGREL